MLGLCHADLKISTTSFLFTVLKASMYILGLAAKVLKSTYKSFSKKWKAEDGKGSVHVQA